MEHSLLSTDAIINRLPILTLNFYDHAIIMTKHSENGVQEYPVDPADISKALAAKIPYSTGFIGGNVVYMGEIGNTQTVIEWRPPQITGIWLEGMDEVLRVPMPGLVIRRITISYASPNYSIYAIKGKVRPTPDTKLYTAPLPNVYLSGSCWGTVRPDRIEKASCELDWSAWFGTRFGSHSASHKSKKYTDDIRQMLVELHNKNAKSYPVNDLIDQKVKLVDILKPRE